MSPAASNKRAGTAVAFSQNLDAPAYPELIAPAAAGGMAAAGAYGAYQMAGPPSRPQMQHPQMIMN